MTSYDLSSAFEMGLNAPILERQAVVGRFLLPTLASGKSTSSASKLPPPALSLACASTGQKVIIHNNNSHAMMAKRSAKKGEADTPAADGGAAQASAEESSIRVLRFNKEPTSLAAGLLHTNDAGDGSSPQHDALLFGSATSILSYDVENNRQGFYKEVEDGVRAVACGAVPNTSSEPGTAMRLALVGGDCSIYGYDQHGMERFWTVTGDQVTAMALVPWSSVGDELNVADPPALLAASEDFEIRVFQGEEVVANVMEVDRVAQLVPAWEPHRVLPEGVGAAAAGKFAYLLDNGTVGVYHKSERLWRVKGKSVPVSAAFCDVDGDGVDELVIGWRSGRVEVRSDRIPGRNGGEVLFREEFSSPIAAVLSADYRQDGHALPMICCTDGTVRGLVMLEKQLTEVGDTRDTQALETLLQERQALTTQLASLSEQITLKASGEEDITLPVVGTEVRWKCQPSLQDHRLHLIFTLHNSQSDTCIQSCVLSSDVVSVFRQTDEESICCFADQPSSTLTCQLEYRNDVRAHVRAAVAVGACYADSFQIYELDIDIPRFVMYQLPVVLQHFADGSGESAPLYTMPEGHATLYFSVSLPMEALEAWFRQAFCVPPELSLRDANDTTAPILHLELICLRDGACLGVEVHNLEAGARSIIVRSDSLSVCAEIISSLGADVLEAGGVFPSSVRTDLIKDATRMEQLLLQTGELNSIHAKLTSDIADAAAVIKSVLTRSEDARLLGDLVNMKKSYAALYDIDCELLGENLKRQNNFDFLKGCLKEVNSFIQLAGKVHLGQQRAEFIAACRAALKENAYPRLVSLIRYGVED